MQERLEVLSEKNRRSWNLKRCPQHAELHIARLVTFSFKDMCFYCTEPIAKCKPGDAAKVTMHKELDAAVRAQIAKSGNDDWAVLERLESTCDLFASDAVYHTSCRLRFDQGVPHTPRNVGDQSKIQQCTPLINCVRSSKVMATLNCIHLNSCMK